MKLAGISSYNGITFHINDHMITAHRKGGKVQVKISSLHKIIKKQKVLAFKKNSLST